MNEIEKIVLEKFKSLLQKKLLIHKIFLFGSRARGDAEPYSDIDVLVVIDKLSGEQDTDYVSDCAWEAGFEHGIVIVPIVFSRDEWENSPERYSLLAQAIEKEGILI